jgi:hypothetical protein
LQKKRIFMVCVLRSALTVLRWNQEPRTKNEEPRTAVTSVSM